MSVELVYQYLDENDKAAYAAARAQQFPIWERYPERYTTHPVWVKCHDIIDGFHAKAEKARDEAMSVALRANATSYAQVKPRPDYVPWNDPALLEDLQGAWDDEEKEWRAARQGARFGYGFK